MVTFQALEDLQYCMYSQQTFPSTVLRLSSTRIVSYCSCTLEWWDVRTPGAILNVFDFLDYTYFKFFNFPCLLISFASLAELRKYIIFLRS